MVTVYKAILTLALLFGVLGFGVPTLISSSDTIFVLTGFGALIGVPALMYFIWSNEIGNLSTKIDEEFEKPQEAPKKGKSARN